MNEKPTHLDLFSGIGGFSLAFEAEGFQTIGFAEIDIYASAVLRKHWPHVPNYGDARTMRGIACDVLTAGVPCQPSSRAGKQAGKSDSRWLWPEAIRLLSESSPSVALFENPVGILDLQSGVIIEEILHSVESNGYEVLPPVEIPTLAVDGEIERARIYFMAVSNNFEIRPLRRTMGRGRRQLQQVSKIGIWEDEDSPLGMGVSSRIPERLDRLASLGNSVDPRVAQIFARAIRQLI